MKINCFLLSMICFSLLLFVRCTEEELVINVESPSVEELLNARLIDEASGLEVNTTIIKSSWEKLIFEETGELVELEKFKLVQIEGLESKYLLKSTSKNGQVQTGAILTRDKNGLFSMGTKKCTCTSKCGSGCDLSVTGSTCSCSPCFPRGECTKTETIEIKT